MSSFNRSNFRSIQMISGDNVATYKSVVICGPSGVGKGTIISYLINMYPTKFGLSVSHTTRSPRAGEVDGKHYHFVSREEFEQDISSGRRPYLEFAKVHSNFYGTRLDSVEAVHKEGKLCILDLDTQGVQQLKQNNFPAKTIFLTPPSLLELERRLRGRNTDSEEQIRLRIHNAVAQIAFGEKQGNFDQVIENCNLDHTIDLILSTLNI
eukprot:gene37055-49996_t